MTAFQIKVAFRTSLSFAEAIQASLNDWPFRL